MSITTYAELQTAVGNWLPDGIATARVQECITIGESRLMRQLRAREMIVRETLTLTSGQAYTAFPTRYQELISLVDDLGDRLHEISEQELDEKRYGTTGARPYFFAQAGRFEWDRAPGANHDFIIWYYKKSDVANDDSISSALLAISPEMYLYSALLAAEKYIMEDERVPMWKAELDIIIEDVNRIASNRIRLLRTEVVKQQGSHILRGGA